MMMSSESSCFFSVIIPTYKRLEDLEHCLRKLLPKAQSYAAENFEVIVSDDDSEMSAVAICNVFGSVIRYCKGPGKGPAANRNNGAHMAKGEWLVFIDDDCLPDGGLLLNYERFIQDNPDYDALEGKIYAPRPQVSFSEKSPLNTTGGAFWSCNIAIRKSLFDRLNGFDEDFAYAANEDQDLQFRIIGSGGSIAYVEGASVCHPWRSMKPFTGYRVKTNSFLLLLQKHQELKNKYTRWNVAKGVLISFKQYTLPGLIRFKFRGMGYEISRILCELYFSLRYLILRDSMIQSALPGYLDK